MSYHGNTLIRFLCATWPDRKMSVFFNELQAWAWTLNAVCDEDLWVERLMRTFRFFLIFFFKTEKFRLLFSTSLLFIWILTFTYYSWNRFNMQIHINVLFSRFMQAVGGRGRWGGGAGGRARLFKQELKVDVRSELLLHLLQIRFCAASPERSPGCFRNIRDLLSSRRALTLVAPLLGNVPLTQNQLGFCLQKLVCEDCCCLVVLERWGSPPGAKNEENLENTLEVKMETTIAFPAVRLHLCCVFRCVSQHFIMETAFRF